jgi:hypothetical protein
MLIPIVPTFVQDFVPAYTAALTTGSGVLSAARTTVQKINPDAIGATGTSIKIIAAAPATGPITLSAAYIGLSAISGNAWNFASTPVQITWDNGQTSKTIAAGQTAESDAASFTVDDSASISLAFNIASGSRILFRTGLGTSRILYFKNSVSEAGTASKGSGYTGASGRSDIVTTLLVA